MANKRNLDKMSIYIPQRKMEEKPVERLIRLGNKKDRSMDYMVLQAMPGRFKMLMDKQSAHEVGYSTMLPASTLISVRNGEPDVQVS